MNPQKLLRIIGTGLLAVGGPQMVEGMFQEWVKKVKISDVEEWVVKDKRIWEQISPAWQEQLLHYGPKMGDLSFLTVEWAVKSATKTNPGLASLFLNWPEALNWLDKNLKDLKKETLNIKEEESIES